MEHFEQDVNVMSNFTPVGLLVTVNCEQIQCVDTNQNSHAVQSIIYISVLCAIEFNFLSNNDHQ